MKLQAILCVQHEWQYGRSYMFWSTKTVIICWESVKEKQENAQCQQTIIRDIEITTNKLQFIHKNMVTERDICIEVYMRWEFCVIYGFMGFMISGNGGLE